MSWVTLLTIAEVVYVLSLSTWILLEKRPAVSTIAWLVSLVGLPYVGFIIYFFFGKRRIERKRLKHRRARGAMHAEAPVPSAGAREEAEHEDRRELQLERLARSTGEPPVAFAEEVTILHDAASTYAAIVLAIQRAKHHVHVGYYIFDSGEVGTRIAEALVAKAKEGVTVRVLLDDVGSSAMKRALQARLREAGVMLAWFNEVRLARILKRFDFRNHRKIVVVDGHVGFTGGINVTDDYLPRGAAPGWRDTHVRFTGDAVRWLQLTFLDDWHFVTRYVPRDARYFPPPACRGQHRVQVVASGPDRAMATIHSLYFAAIALAQSRVLVTSPYFVPDDAMLAALTTAALRGVDVRVLVPRRGDSRVVTAAARSYYDELITAGVRVFEYQPTMHHAKTLVVDDFFAAVGTANMDNRSFRLNFEVTAILYGESHAGELARQFEVDLETSREITAKARARLSFTSRMSEAGARVLSPLL